ncbi:MAG TPA: hypothetical protein VKR29_09345 [Candidatus Binataceae bacterium]|nr:hypothetical protein [Candidatus Binataceae bacterium]
MAATVFAVELLLLLLVTGLASMAAEGGSVTGAGFSGCGAGADCGFTFFSGSFELNSDIGDSLRREIPREAHREVLLNDHRDSIKAINR